MKKTLILLATVLLCGTAMAQQQYDTVENRYRRYYYRQWYDTCQYYFSKSQYDYQLFMLTTGTQYIGYRSQVAVSDYTDSPMKIEGVAVMVSFGIDGEPPYQSPKHADEYVYVGYYDSASNSMTILDSARWDTVQPKIMRLQLIADTSVYRRTWAFPSGIAYCYLYEAYFQQPVTVDSTFYVIGSMNSNVTGLAGDMTVYLNKPVHYANVVMNTSGAIACIPDNPAKHIFNRSEYHPYWEVYHSLPGGYGPFLPIISSQHLVTVSSADTAAGTVRGGSYCRDSTYTQLRALPRYGYKFSHWNDGDTSNPRQVFVTSDTAFTAYFAGATFYKLSVMTNNEDWGTVSGAGSYPEGTVAVIGAEATEIGEFVRWEDRVWTNPREVRVTSDTAFTAIFRAKRMAADSPAEQAAGFTLSPNPTHGVFELRIKDFDSPRYNYRNAAVVVLDEAGHEVLRNKVTGPVMQLNGLPAGAYFVTLVTPQGSHTEKLLVK